MAFLTRPLPTLLLTNFAGTLGYSIVMPFLVFLVHTRGGNALIYGLVAAAYPAFQLIGGPILGRWSDRFGRRRVLFLSQLGTALSWTVAFAAFFAPAGTLLVVDSSLLGKFSLTMPLILLFFARSLDGLTGADQSVANAYVADITPKNERDRAFGSKSARGRQLPLLAARPLRLRSARSLRRSRNCAAQIPPVPPECA